MSFNGIISVLRSRIVQLQLEVSGVTIRNEHHTHHYPNGYLVPGLVDSHVHLLGFGLLLNGIRLFHAKSAKECIEHAREVGPQQGEWITGMGWNQEQWEAGKFPTKHDIDSIIQDNPVFLRRADGHSAWLNSKALQIAGITKDTGSPEGGEIVKDENGEPTGILVDNAMNLVSHCIPPYSTEHLLHCIKSALKECSRVGLTEIHDMDVSPDYIDLYRSLAETGDLPCRIQTWVSGQNYEWQKSGVLPAVGEFQRTIGVKFFADGALGSRGAHLLQPYHDDTNTNGISMLSESDLYERCVAAISDGFHISTHAIGDAANRMVLDVYARLRKEKIADDSTLLRIEHAQIVHPDDVNSFKENSIIACVQPAHCIGDAEMAVHRLGERVSYAYPWNSLLQSGVRIAGGSDFPIESHNPLTGIHAYCTNQKNGADINWHSHEKITREQAIESYTSWAHESADEQYRRGKLEIGFDADFTIFDRDIYACSPEELLEAKVLATYTAGVLRYSNQ